MTMFASRVHENSPNIKVGITYGPVSTSIDEDYHHLRSFWGQLGKLLDDMETEAKIREEAKAKSEST